MLMHDAQNSDFVRPNSKIDGVRKSWHERFAGVLQDDRANVRTSSDKCE